jgi:Holliday junction resolvasome RuvABC endonuclease subunit
MGLDLSLNATGVFLADGRAMTVKFKDAAHGDNRLCIIRDTVRRFLPVTDLVVIEDKLHSTYQAATLGMVQGVIRTELMDHGVPYALVPPKTLKKYATDNGNADKALMVAAALEQAGLRFKDDNQCDAWWLQQAGHDHYGLPMSIPAPDQARSALLTVVDWPMITDRRAARV